MVPWREDDIHESEFIFLSHHTFASNPKWNTRNEIAMGGFFNQYYGSDTREYIARYDRIYTTVGETVSNKRADTTTTSNRKEVAIDVKSFDLIANRPIGDSKHHFLSDHFGLATTFCLTEKPVECL
jgi:hypothetical protein